MSPDPEPLPALNRPWEVPSRHRRPCDDILTTSEPQTADNASTGRQDVN